jgi:hypothetical protein
MPIRSDFNSEQKSDTFRIGLIKLFHSRIGSDFDIRKKELIIIHALSRELIIHACNLSKYIIAVVAALFV